MSKLTELKIKSLTQQGRFADGNNLYLKVSPHGNKSWSCRYMFEGKTVEMGLGSYPAVSLKEARHRRSEVQLEVSRGFHPAEERKAARAASMQQKQISFEQAAYCSYKIKKTEWKNGKHQAQWIDTLKTYVFPKIGKMYVCDIQPADIVKCLSPIWLEKIETSQRVRQRIEFILNWAKAMGYREGENPATLKGNLEFMLPRQKKNVAHHPALEFKFLPSFWKDLKQLNSVSADALQFLIFTAARSGEVRGAEWAEIDWNHGIWTVPANRMKSNKVHRVPLSDVAVAILKKRRSSSKGSLIFEGQKSGRPISDMAMLSVMRKRFPNINAVPHGFRSSFRDWAEHQDFSHRAIEYCLAHTLKSKVEAAYQRDDLLEQRRVILREWQRYITLP